MDKAKLCIQISTGAVEEIKKSAVASNAILGLILAGVEKAVQVQFACPCDPEENEWFASAYFILPGVFASILMFVIQVDKFCDRKEIENVFFFGLVPAIMWLTLVFLSGQYYVCAKTNWKGKFVIIDKADPQRWCEPVNGTSYNERMSDTHKWYFHSQGIGLIIISICTMLLIAYGAYKCNCKRKTKCDEIQKEQTEVETGNTSDNVGRATVTATGQQPDT